MALPVQDQLKYWGIAAAVFLVVLWLLGDVLLPFVLAGAIAYCLDPVADRLEVAGLPRWAATQTSAPTVGPGRQRTGRPIRRAQSLA